MKLVAIVSETKESVYALIKALRLGHQVVGLLTLYDDEIAHNLISSPTVENYASYVAECLGIPLFARPQLPISDCVNVQSAE